MSRTLKVGDRVCLTALNHKAEYKRGDRGRVVWGPHSPADGKPYYVVVMEANRIGCPEVFIEDEIEAADEA
jgi:hypothetical protein